MLHPWIAAWLALTAGAPGDNDTWGASEQEGKAPAAPPQRVLGLSGSLLDPAGHSQFHLTTQVTFADAHNAFSGSSAWSLEARAQFQVAHGFALNVAAPLGIALPEIGAASVAVGNVSIGATLGGAIEAGALKLRVGGGLDVYIPSAPAYADAHAGLVAAMRAAEPQLYVPQLLSFRGRGHVDLYLEPLFLGLDLGLVPGLTVGSGPGAESGFVLLFSAAARVSVDLGPVFEPFLEVAATTEVAGIGQIAPPFMVTPGLRFHIADFLDPAVFASFNFVAGNAVILGIDLAAVIRGGTRQQRSSERRERDSVDF